MTEAESTRPLFLPKSKLKLRRSRKAWPSRRQSLRRGPRTPGTPTRTRPILTEDSHPAASTAIRLRHEVPHPHRRVHPPRPRIPTGPRHTQVRYVMLLGFFDDRKYQWTTSIPFLVETSRSLAICRQHLGKNILLLLLL